MPSWLRGGSSSAAWGRGLVGEAGGMGPAETQTCVLIWTSGPGHGPGFWDVRALGAHSVGPSLAPGQRLPCRVRPASSPGSPQGDQGLASK